MDKITALKILNLDTNASFEEAKKAYRNLAKKHHPDVVAKNNFMEKDAESKMKDINLAFRYLAPQLRSNNPAGEVKESSKNKQSHKQPKDNIQTAKEESFESESDEINSRNSIGKKIIESFVNIFFKRKSTTRPLKKKVKKEQVLRKRADKVFFEDVFKQVHKGSFSNTEKRTKKKKNTGHSNIRGTSDYYQKYMILKRKMKSVQSRTNQNMTIQRVEKIDPVRPVNPISKKK